jgi:hypothetical protein
MYYDCVDYKNGEEKVYKGDLLEICFYEGHIKIRETDKDYLIVKEDDQDISNELEGSNEVFYRGNIYSDEFVRLVNLGKVPNEFKKYLPEIYKMLGDKLKK